MSKTYNGHKNWNHWNVSLWLNNDEALYQDLKRVLRQHSTKQAAAEELLNDLQDLGITKTPDGAPYSVSSIRAAMTGMEA